MTESEQSALKKLHKLLLLAIALLVIAEVSSLAISSSKYLFSVLGSSLFAGIQWLYWHKKGGSSLIKTMVLVVLLMTVLSPIIFFMMKVLFLGESILGVELMIACTFITPILLMLYIDKRLVQLMEN
jgi:phosphate/sulfate permease